ncbi:hypothetical protein HAX54_043475 [Datura stramonium]|uniref:Uncharacterized protein n=1 Tax=Datura stramonium TaxID=4076 RepID=A0ABS8W1B6_DATST|nr:hypothetical protein [Datura stramonium]
MVYLLSEGVTVLDQKRNKIRFTESREQKKVRFAGDKLIATGQIQVERAWKGSSKPVRVFVAVGVPEVSQLKLQPESPDRFGSSCKWESVGTEDESGAVLAVTDVGAWGSFNGPSG